MKNYNPKNLLFIIPSLIVFGGFVVFSLLKNINPSHSSATPQAIIFSQGFFVREKKIKLDIADTAEKQWLGLSNRSFLEKDSGMLFIFPNKQERTFVMRNMNFSLDIVWLEDNRIVGISPKLNPEGSDYKEKYSSIFPVNYVLEVNGGFCEENDVKIGDKIDFLL